ncbi:MAG: hypothetical protein ABS49_00760 [Erythrobacter sp. SCN 62-14]|nr:MAG: hypothetical protein ABS49_00760 [Erythrobacter sp. SCN 62-14]
MADQASGIRDRIRAREASRTVSQYDRRTSEEPKATTGGSSFFRKLAKWTAITIGVLIALVAAIGIIAETTATPEDKARWAAERAEREKERAIREAAELAARQRAEAEEAAREAQFKCLRSLDGSMGSFAIEVKYELRDPDSFEHIQSFATAVDADGTQRVRMKFRARNGFGGMNVEMAEAVVDNSDCEVRSWRFIR